MDANGLGGDGSACGPCVPLMGTNILQSGRLRVLAGQQQDLIIEIRNGNFDFRFLSGWTEPFSELIDVTAISARRPGDRSDSELLRGDPMRLQQLTSDPRLGQALQFLDALDTLENKSEIIFTLNNLEVFQAVEVTITLTGYWQVKPMLPIERREMVPCDPVNGDGSERREATPHRGPLSGAGNGGNGNGRGYVRPSQRG